MKIFIAFLILSLLSSLSIAGENTETPVISKYKAKKILENKGVKYTKKSFLQAVKNNDAVVVKLFLQAKASPNSTEALTGIPILSLAIANGSVDVVKLLLEHSADVNKESDDKTTPLIVSSAFNNQDILNLIIQGKANVNVKNNAGITPLTSAIIRNHIKNVKILLEYKADVNYVDDQVSVLTHSVLTGNKEIVKLLIKHGADVNGTHKGKTSLGYAVMQGKKGIVKLFMESDIEQQHLDSVLKIARSLKKNEIAKLLIQKGAKDPEGDSKLMLKEKGISFDAKSFGKAIESKNIELIKLFLDTGMSPNIKIKGERNAFGKAIKTDSLEIVKLLADKGADVNHTQPYGNNILSYAMSLSQGTKADGSQRTLDIVKYLLNKGANPKYQGHNGVSFLRLLIGNRAWKRDSALLEQLLREKKIKPDDIYDESKQPLIFAVGEDSKYNERIKILIKYGANLNVPASSLSNPLLMNWIEEKNVERIKLYCNNGGDLNIIDGYGYSPLMRAVENKSFSLVKYLIRKGAKINYRGKNGGTALGCSCSSKITRYLKSKGAKGK